MAADFKGDHKNNCGDKKENCAQLPGTILRIFIPAGTVINLLNLIEIASPTGICVIIRLPLLGGGCGSVNGISNLLDAFRQAGGKIEMVNA